jgi:hypothetical protein
VAIYSLNHSSIGRSTHAAGTAGAHVGYITRSGACLTVIAERMPLAVKGQRGGEARAWLDDQEAADRKNARVIDKVMLALPRELTAEQQAALVRDFAEEITLGRASWLAAIHQDHPDNPHAHLVIRDKDPETGKRVVGLSEKGSTDRLREAWEVAANLALEGAGREERIDRRSLKDQGADREATIHVGPQAAAMERQGKPVDSQVRDTPCRGGIREVRWPEIDGGHTRASHNDRVRAQNAARERARGRRTDAEALPARFSLEGPQRAPEPSLVAVAAPATASPYASLSFAALSTAWTDHLQVVLVGVIQRAEKLMAKIDALTAALDRRLEAHREAAPSKPRIQAFGGIERWQEKRADWAKDEKRIQARYWQVRKRAERVKEYTSTTRGEQSLSKFPTRADRLAAHLAEKMNPDLAVHLAAAKSVDAQQLQKGRQAQPDQPRHDRGRGGPSR